MTDLRIELSKNWDWGAIRRLATWGSMTVDYFRYDGGTAAVKISSDVGEIIVLPFQGQQIWDATFHGRSMRMRSMFEEPVQSHDFLRNYGAFLIHCGATAVGPPGRGDVHPPHGELPNASFNAAHVRFGEEGGTRYVELGGEYHHTVGFNTNYVFRPVVRMSEGSTSLAVSVEIENLKNSPMEVMYLAHANFRATAGMEILDNAKRIRLRKALPSHVKQPPGFVRMMAALEENPQSHRRITAETFYDPEVVFFLEFEENEAVCLGCLPDGSADFIRYRTRELPRATRWISRTVDQECVGLSLPGTAESEGLERERQKGNGFQLGAAEKYHCSFSLGRIAGTELQILRTELVDGI